MGAAGELFLLAARRLGSAGKRQQEHSGVEHLLETLDYLDHDESSIDHRSLIRNRAAILRAAAAVSGLFSAESPDAPEAKFFCGTAEPKLLGKGYEGFPAVSVAGCDRNPGRAFERCIGEAMEYLSQVDAPGDSREAVDDGLRDADGLASLSDEPRIRAVALGTGAEVALPARLCLRRPGQAEPLVGTGCAAGRTWIEAVSAGLWELIERDAVAAWWHGGAPARPLPDALEREVADYVSGLRAGSDRRQTLFLDITSRPGLPAVAACSFRQRGGGFVAGFAAHLDVMEAARKAAREMLQMELGLRFVEANQALARARLNADEQAQLSRAEEVTPGHRPLRASGAPRAFDRPPEGSTPDHTLSATLALLRRQAIQTYAADLTRTRFGIPVAKVVAPGLRQVPEETAWAAGAPGGRVPLF